MNHLSPSKLLTALLLTSGVYLIWGSTFAAIRVSTPAQQQLDQLIPRDKWEGNGLTKLTLPEQQTLAEEITALVGSSRSQETGTTATKDHSQWRMLKRHMSKDDVKKLLGEPMRVSVSRFYEAWDFPTGTVIFDGKGRLDTWSEM